MVFTLEGADKGYLTCVLEVDIIAIVCILQFVGHHTESHDLLPDERVGPRDVHVHLRVVDLVGQPVIHDLRQVPEGTERETSWGEAEAILKPDSAMFFLTVNQNIDKTWAWFPRKNAKQ